MIEMDILLGESLVVDKSLRLQVLAARPGIVKLGFEAPPEICIIRSELLELRPSAEPAEAFTPNAPRYPFTLKRRF